MKAILVSISCLFIRVTGITVPLLMKLPSVRCRETQVLKYSVKNARLLARP